MLWHKLTQPRNYGRLRFIDCKTHAQALLSKWISKALEDPTTKRACLFLALFEDFTWEKKRVTNLALYIPWTEFYSAKYALVEV